MQHEDAEACILQTSYCALWGMCLWWVYQPPHLLHFRECFSHPAFHIRVCTLSIYWYRVQTFSEDMIHPNYMFPAYIFFIFLRIRIARVFATLFVIDLPSGSSHAMFEELLPCILYGNLAIICIKKENCMVSSNYESYETHPVSTFHITTYPLPVLQTYKQLPLPITCCLPIGTSINKTSLYAILYSHAASQNARGALSLPAGKCPRILHLSYMSRYISSL